MNQRIANKRVKNDILIQLWLKNWYWSSQYNFQLWIHEPNLTELGKILYPIYRWMDDYEMTQCWNIAKRKYRLKDKQLIKVGFPYLARILVKGRKPRVIKNKAQRRREKKTSTVIFSDEKVSLADIFND